MTQHIRKASERGLYGWRVTDCIVTMNECGYYVGDGPSKRVLPTPRTTAADFRKLTPIVLEDALARAGTVVCEPTDRVRLEVPTARMGAALSAIARLGASVEAPLQHGDQAVLMTVLPSAQVRSLHEQLPGLAGGEGVIEASFCGYRPVHGSLPSFP
jgi:ribosomal protection tetracycline resistance protein